MTLFSGCLAIVLKRAKAKKSKNDLIGAEEGDPFADISSVGEFTSFQPAPPAAGDL